MQLAACRNGKRKTVSPFPASYTLRLRAHFGDSALPRVCPKADIGSSSAKWADYHDYRSLKESVRIADLYVVT